MQGQEQLLLRHTRAGSASSPVSCCLKAHCAPAYMLNVPVTIILQVIRHVPGSIDKDGLCYCVIYLPNNVIPLKQLEQLQHAAQELLSKYEQELSRVSAGAVAGAGTQGSTGAASPEPSMRMSSGGKERAEGSTASSLRRILSLKGKLGTFLGSPGVVTKRLI